MVEVYAASADTIDPADRSTWRRYQEQRNKLEVLEFDRNEMNAKALRQLRETLTEAQRLQIRLPDEIADGGAEDDRSL